MRAWLWRAFSRFVAIRPVTLFFMRLATVVDRPLLKATRGRVRLSFVVPMLLLVCRGARTGIVREVPLLYVPADPDLLLIGSNGGQERDPAWCHNLRAHPEVTCLVRGAERRVHARELTGEERAAAWQKALGVYPGYLRYEERAGRLIPVFRLEEI